MSILRLLVYIPLQILLLPLGIVGVVLVGYRQIIVSRRLGISQTAIEILNGRWTMHHFGLRDDPATASLARTLPNTSVPGLALALLPLWVTARISGRPFLYPKPPRPGHESIAELVTARTVYFDRILRRVLGDAGQFILLGAGYDTRAYGSLTGDRHRAFELDRQRMQDHKRAMLAEAGIDTGSVCFVPVDFSRDDLFERLSASGYRRSEVAVFLWEGVTLYLGEDAVRETMRSVRANAAPGSVLLADLYGSRFTAIGRGGAVRKTLESTGEGLRFSLPFENAHESVLKEFVESEGLIVGETYHLGSTSAKGPFMTVVEMRVPVPTDRGEAHGGPKKPG